MSTTPKTPKTQKIPKTSKALKKVFIQQTPLPPPPSGYIKKTMNNIVDQNNAKKRTADEAGLDNLSSTEEPEVSPNDKDDGDGDVTNLNAETLGAQEEQSVNPPVIEMDINLLQQYQQLTPEQLGMIHTFGSDAATPLDNNGIQIDEGDDEEEEEEESYVVEQEGDDDAETEQAVVTAEWAAGVDTMLRSFLEKQNEILNIIKDNGSTKKSRDNDDSEEESPPPFPVDLPCKSREDLVQMETWLGEHQQNKKSLSKKLTMMGGDNVSTAVSKVMGFIMTNQQARPTTWTGVTAGSYKFSETALASIVSNAVVKIGENNFKKKGTPSFTVAEIEKCIKLWLQKAGDRVKSDLRRQTR